MSESTDELSNAEATENEVQDTGVSDENATTGIDQDLIQSIPVTVTAELGSAKLKLKDLLRLNSGERPGIGYSRGVILESKSEWCCHRERRGGYSR